MNRITELFAKQAKTGSTMSDEATKSTTSKDAKWPPRPAVFSDLLNEIEAAQYLRLDETGRHTPVSAIRTLNYFRDHGGLRATKYVRRVWYLKKELERFLEFKTEDHNG